MFRACQTVAVFVIGYAAASLPHIFSELRDRLQELASIESPQLVLGAIGLIVLAFWLLIYYPLEFIAWHESMGHADPPSSFSLLRPHLPKNLRDSMQTGLGVCGSRKMSEDSRAEGEPPYVPFDDVGQTPG
eukprot:CAMPEP_0205831410 /NCGR_PEP_ID=MMETSP0206-20130828/44005_1 /ASSEMBLY_ACC=CAM_ASM_000279 /TAXON_ID=36767 /ORGANISM="Euplotes focardii, Strain TN1" /LENGTH=130 /DNA_ID=CAMNT_0053136013 /DNA_START=28 /DNA_END=420 /DNA_ORIENTATION=+